MNIYILDDVRHLTDRYHSGGGAVVIAASLDDAKRLLWQATDEEWDRVVVYELLDQTRKPTVFAFPDAGCC